MTTLKKIAALFLGAVLLVGLLPASAPAGWDEPMDSSCRLSKEEMRADCAKRLGITVEEIARLEEAALAYLVEKLGLPAEEIDLAWGHVEELPLTGEQLWMGKYAGVRNSSISGGVYYRVKTQEYLDREAGEALLQAERTLQRQEQERLSREAGKISVYLYQQVIQAASGEKFTVVIWPRYVETAEIEAALQAIDAEYPEFPRGEFYGRPVQIDGGEGSSASDTPAYTGDAGAVEPAAPPGDAPNILPYPLDTFIDVAPEVLPEGGGISGAGEQFAPDRPVSSEDKPLPDDEKTWQRYEEMYRRLNEARLQGYAAALETLLADLRNMGANFETVEGSPAVQAELTAEQVLLFKDRDYVEAVHDGSFAAMEFAAVEMDSRGASLLLDHDDSAAAAPVIGTDGELDGDSGGFPCACLLFLPVLAAGTVVVLVRKKRNALSGAGEQE